MFLTVTGFYRSSPPKWLKMTTERTTSGERGFAMTTDGVPEGHSESE